MLYHCNADKRKYDKEPYEEDTEDRYPHMCWPDTGLCSDNTGSDYEYVQVGEA